MGFQQGLSGLNASSTNLDVISNNISNSSTVGFKGAATQFADVYANSIYGTSNLVAGIGTKVAAVAQSFTQGNITTTNNPLDVAISGDGFFRLSSGGAITYTRNGQFHLDANGYLVTNGGQNVTGYTSLTTNTSGAVTGASNLGSIHIDLNNLAPNATSAISMGVNLNATSPTISGAFNPADSTTYNYTTSTTVYDSQGGSHALTYYFTKTASNTWNVHATLDGTSGTSVSVSPSTLTFGTDGSLTSSPNLTITTTGLAPAVNELNIAMNLTGSTQVASSSGVNSVSQDGYAAGQISSLSIDNNGIIYGNYSNGLSRPLQQILLANFQNANGLTSIGDNQWVATQAAGAAVLNAPGSSVAGTLQSGSTEDSNVNLTTELVNLIVAQRQYQANAQSIKAEDTILQTLVNLG